MDKPFPSYAGDEPYVFVCYAHADEKVVYPEIHWLYKHGVNVWYDEGISAGKVWRAEIADAIQGAPKLLYYISKASLQSAHCNREIEYALDKELEIVPVYLDETELSPELDLALHRIQALHRTNDVRYQQHLLDALSSSTISRKPIATAQPKHRRRFLQVGMALAILIGTSWWYWSPKESSMPRAPEPIPSIAVLPFVNMSDDPAQQYFSDGISEELINALARLPGLRVTARASSFQFAGSLAGVDVSDVARQLGVATLLEGSVRRSGDTVRVTARLVNADDGFQMWSQSFDREISDIFAIQDEIATAITAALRVQLSLEGNVDPRVQRAASIDAYNLYLLGRYHFEKRTVFELEEAQRYFESAIERDPGYAPAYNGLSDTILSQMEGAFGYQPREQQIAHALPLIEKSLELDPLLAETHASLGFLRFFERDLLAAEAALIRATNLSPNLSRAYVWLYITYENLVQPVHAFEALQRAFALDPLSPIVNANMAAELWIRNRTDDALKAANRILQVAPDISLGYNRTGRIKWTSGELAEAVDWYRQSIEIAPEDRNSKLELGALLVDLGNYDEAEGLLGNQRYIAYLAQGRLEDALAIVRTSLEERPDQLSTIFATAHTEARVGNFGRVRNLLEPLAEGAETGEGSLFRRSGIHFWDLQIAAMDLAVARLETGDTESGLALLSEIRIYFAFLNSEGFEHPILSFQQARILALEEKLDEALGVLRHTIAAGWRFWYMNGDPALKNLWERREFRSIVNDVDMLVDLERAKLSGNSESRSQH